MEKSIFPRLDKTAFSVVSLEEADDDEVAFWLSKTPYERLDALETLRQIFYAIQIPPDFKGFLKLLNEHEVRYLLIGGYAVSTNLT